MAAEGRDDKHVYDCPMCIDDIVSELGNTKLLLLNILDVLAKDGFVKLNGHLFPIGKLSPFYEDSLRGKRALLGYSGMASCGHMLGHRWTDRLIPHYL